MVRRVAASVFSIALASSAVVLADARSDSASPPDRAGYTYPTQQSLSDGVYDFTNVLANHGAALAEERRAYSELNITVVRLQKEFETSPEYKAAVTELDQSHEALDGARRVVLEQVAGDPRYKDLMEKHDRVGDVISGGGLETRDLYDLAERKMEYGSDARKMEASALNDNSAVQSARARLVAAQQKLDDLRDRFEATIYQNPQWASAKQALENARIATAAADEAVVGATVSQAVASDALSRRSAYGYYQYNGGNNGYGYYNGDVAPRY